MKADKFVPNISTKGVHECICGAESDPCDYELEDGFITNSLCVHYLAYHRSEIPQSELDKIINLKSDDKLDESLRGKLNTMLHTKSESYDYNIFAATINQTEQLAAATVNKDKPIFTFNVCYTK